MFFLPKRDDPDNNKKAHINKFLAPNQSQDNPASLFMFMCFSSLVFFFQNFWEAPWLSRQKSWDIPPKSLLSLGFEGRTELFCPHPIHMEDPHPTRRYPDPESLILCSFFLHVQLHLCRMATTALWRSLSLLLVNEALANKATEQVAYIGCHPTQQKSSGLTCQKRRKKKKKKKGTRRPQTHVRRRWHIYIYI